MFVIIITYKKPLDIVDQHLAAHRSFLEKGYKEDLFVVSGPQHPRTGGVIISQIKDRDHLEKVLQNDPFYINDIADYKLIEFEPVKYHVAFSGFVGAI
jgi:uncharacterized protein YciI